MSEPVRVPPRAVTAIHDRQIARHRGVPGMRDVTLLEVGSSRAMDLAAHAEPSVEEIAPAHTLDTAETHAFVDGNKRAAFVGALTFLRPNGLAFPAPAEGVRMMEGRTSGHATEARSAQWLTKGTAPV